MPRREIEIPFKLEYLSILDEDGKVDKELEPKLDPEIIKDMFFWMLYARRVDERLLKLQRQGRVGTFPQASGHEAISLGSAVHLLKNDWHVPAYRELAGMLYRGWPLETILLYWMGYEEGAQAPEDVKDLPISVPIASQLQHAVGLALANNLRGDQNVVLTYFGDGASSEGDCHESMNFAAVFQAPVVFVCLNNQYAISVPIERQMRNKTIAQRAIAYGMPGIQIDGNDVLAVYVATAEAIERARSGGGPSLIEAITYRYTPHTSADDPSRYRTDSEREKWFAREPLIRFERYLRDKKVLGDSDLQNLEKQIEERIDQAIAKAEEMCKLPPYSDPLAMFNHLYAQPPAHIVDQKEELAAHLRASSKPAQQKTKGGTSHA